MGNNAVTWSEHVLSTNKKGRRGKFFVTILFIKCSKHNLSITVLTSGTQMPDIKFRVYSCGIATSMLTVFYYYNNVLFLTTGAYSKHIRIKNFV